MDRHQALDDRQSSRARRLGLLLQHCQKLSLTLFERFPVVLRQVVSAQNRQPVGAARRLCAASSRPALDGYQYLAFDVNRDLVLYRSGFGSGNLVIASGPYCPLIVDIHQLGTDSKPVRLQTAGASNKEANSLLPHEIIDVGRESFIQAHEITGDQVKGDVAREPAMKSAPQPFCVVLCSGSVACVLERQHCNSNPLFGVVTLRQELRSIAAWFQVDYDSIRRTFTKIIALQALAQTLHSHPNGGIAPRVEI